MKVKKRDGRIQDFDVNKIKITLEKASDEVDKPLNLSDIDNIARDIEKNIKSRNVDIINVCDIQDIVLEELINNKFKDVAYHYENYKKTNGGECK